MALARIGTAENDGKGARPMTGKAIIPRHSALPVIDEGQQLVTAIVRMAEEERAGAIAEKQFGVAHQCTRTIAQILNLLKCEAQVPAVVVNISKDDLGLL